MRPAGQLLANRLHRRLFHVNSTSRPRTIFMHGAIAGEQTRSIERTEDVALWLIEFASCLDAEGPALHFRTASFDAVETDGHVSRTAR